MAYLTEYIRRCPCGKAARFELHNQVNASIGFYCGPCGRAAEKRLQADEDAANARRRAEPVMPDRGPHPEPPL